MTRSFPWVWILLAALLLLIPGPAGRLLLDLLGGLTLTLLLLPLLAGGAAVLGWQLLKRRLRTCPNCGLASIGTPVCPACGTVFSAEDRSADPPWGDGMGSTADVDPRTVTINVDAVDVDGDVDPDAVSSRSQSPD